MHIDINVYVFVYMCVQLGITKDCQSIFINGSAFWQTKIAWATLGGYQWIGYWKSSTSTNISITIKWFLVVVDCCEAGASVSSLKSYGKISKYSTYKYLFRLFSCKYVLHVMFWHFTTMFISIYKCSAPSISSFDFATLAFAATSIFFGWYFGTHLRYYV